MLWERSDFFVPELYDSRVKSSRVYRECQRNFLKNELRYKERECLRVEKLRENLQQVLKSTVSILDYNHLIHYSDKFNEKKMNSILATHKKKLYKLGYTDDIKLEPDKVLFNLASTVLSDVEKSALSKGLKFVLRPNKLSF